MDVKTLLFVISHSKTGARVLILNNNSRANLRTQGPGAHRGFNSVEV